MTTLNIQIRLDNAAFDTEYLRDLEIESLLTHISEQIIAGYKSRAVIDTNGNNVGRFEIVEA